MNATRLSGLTLLVVCVGGAAWWWSSARFASPKSLVSSDSRQTGNGVTTPLAVKATPASTSEAKATLLDDFVDRLNGANAPAASREILTALRTLLDSLPREVASHEALAFLAGQKDAGTKLDVTVKPGGTLGDASSLRVFLLDYLGQIDRPAAAVLGKQILSTPDSPDEWAVSLRNVAWGDDTPANLDYLRAKAREMISNPKWRQNPSAGFLEAFDVIVHAKGFNLVPQLTELVRDKENRAVGHAAYLTLDRLTIADPAAALAPLAAHPEWMEGREQTRANFFARADVNDPRQKALLESYLLDPHRSALELQTFAGLYPNANYMISNNLLSETSTPTNTELAARDRAALEVLDSWLNDSRFARLLPQLEATRARLQSFVQQASPLKSSP